VVAVAVRRRRYTDAGVRPEDGDAQISMTWTQPRLAMSCSVDGDDGGGGGG